ncbi:hypothetical protein GXB81_13005 [Paraburkholderia sp. Ac-20336]|uniref:hypothetical protein n=2 Tax=unclassified Paraburkholderia TaxID=2615204 RepID=UPI00197F2C27|nr:hypothetical protein [Paraburkholderia sp. Ac-20342]MBN3803963.1 hypothetical protein [Paraburkholderia sp. Ac-20336]MBN3847276.1 hypothetical protein [Paraburkholderia sp. Ac-20342]
MRSRIPPQMPQMPRVTDHPQWAQDPGHPVVPQQPVWRGPAPNELFQNMPQTRQRRPSLAPAGPFPVMVHQPVIPVLPPANIAHPRVPFPVAQTRQRRPSLPAGPFPLIPGTAHQPVIPVTLQTHIAHPHLPFPAMPVIPTEAEMAGNKGPAKLVKRPPLRDRSNSFSEAVSTVVKSAKQASAAIGSILPNKGKAPVESTKDGLIVRGGAHLSHVLSFLMKEDVPEQSVLIAVKKGDEISLKWGREYDNETDTDRDRARTCLEQILSESIQPDGGGVSTRSEKGWEIIENRPGRGRTLSQVGADRRIVKENRPTQNKLLKNTLRTLSGTRPLTAKKLRGILPKMSEEIYKTMASKIPAAQRRTDEAPRPLGDCLAEWMDALDTALSKANKRSTPVIEIMKNQAREQWLSHGLGDEQTANYFYRMIAYCNRNGLGELSGLCGKLSTELSRAVAMKSTAAERIRWTGAMDGDTGMNARAYGSQMRKTWETALILHLTEKGTPPKAIRAADSFRASLRWILTDVAARRPADFDAIAGFIQHSSIGYNPQLQLHSNPALKKFVEPGSANAGNKLLAYLNQKIRTGADIGPIYLMDAPIVEGLRAFQDPLAWMWEPQETLGAVEELTAERDRNIASVEKTNVAGRGIQPIHMPPLRHDPMKDSTTSKPSNHYRLNLTNPTRTNSISLEHDLPMASGVSGSALLVAKLMLSVNKQLPGQLDPEHVILGTAMSLLNDGGHSLSEVMWPLNQLKARGINLGFIDQPVNPANYVADYRHFFNAFSHDGETMAALNDAQDYAYTEMIAHRRKITSDSLAVDDLSARK